MVSRITEFLKAVIGADDVNFYGDRIIFAICVREIECWLLPLWDDQKATKCEGCLDTLNRALSKANEQIINPYNKSASVFSDISKGYKKRKTLMEQGILNPSLECFLAELSQRNIKLNVE